MNAAVLTAEGRVSEKCKGSLEATCASCSIQRPSSSNSSRCRAFRRKWCWHFAQTCALASRSFFHTMARQPVHLVHSPSVFTRRSSGGVGCSIDFFVHLNQDIGLFRSATATIMPAALVVNPALRENPFRKGMLHFPHLSHQARRIRQRQMAIAA